MRAREKNLKRLGPPGGVNSFDVGDSFPTLQIAPTRKPPYRFRRPVARKPPFLPATAFVKFLVASENEVLAAERVNLQRRGGWPLAALNAASHAFRHCWATRWERSRKIVARLSRRVVALWKMSEGYPA